MLESLNAQRIAPVIIGHQKRWAALARAFAKNSVPQTLLISGPPQTGKETLTRRYAQLLLCPNVAPGADGLPAPCGHCRTCHQVEIETFPDYKVYRPLAGAAKDEKDWVIASDVLEGSILTVEVARKFGDEAMRRPMIGPRKVMLIVQSERMNVEAQNALLKTFEEPVRGLTIILLADNPSQLLATVRSRCWHLPLGLAADAEIVAWLQEQFVDAPPAMLQEAARVAAGRPGKAWREARRLLAQDDEDDDVEAPGNHISRFVETENIVERIMRSQPVGALGITEAALRLARGWWAEDQVLLKNGKAPSASKKLEGRELRSAAARFLDELATVYRARWSATLQTGGTGPDTEAWAVGLDQVRRTRHYILRNANTNLALDVLFGRLIAAQRELRKKPKNRV